MTRSKKPLAATLIARNHIGGARRDRTADLLRAKQALSQLSYGPVNVVGLGRFELPTSPLSGVRSNHLSYRPIIVSEKFYFAEYVLRACTPEGMFAKGQIPYFGL